MLKNQFSTKNRFSYLQVFFWIIAYLIISFVMFLAMGISRSDLPVSLPLILLCGCFLGFFQGFLFVIAELLPFHIKESKNSLFFNIVYRSGINLTVTISSLFIFREFVYDKLTCYFLGADMDALPDRSWKNIFLIITLLNFILSFAVGFVTQVARRFGPGMMMPILTGKYQSPREEERIFVFMDLRSSTTIAEQLGHLTYSGFIRDCYQDLNVYIGHYDGEIYQYVGDEIVLTWKKKRGLKNNNYINYVLCCQNVFEARKHYYQTTYNVIPFFKAGAHLGKVIVVEVGDLKREIAFHGDTINTAARIQQLCNTFDKSFLISDDLAENINHKRQIRIEQLPEVLLRGKRRETKIFSIEGFDTLYNSSKNIW